MAMNTKRKARTLRLTQQDIEVIALLKAHYGITSDNEVIRMALRAALRELPSTPHPERNAFPSTPSNGVGFQAI